MLWVFVAFMVKSFDPTQDDETIGYKAGESFYIHFCFIFPILSGALIVPAGLIGSSFGLAQFLSRCVKYVSSLLCVFSSLFYTHKCVLGLALGPDRPPARPPLRSDRELFLYSCFWLQSLSSVGDGLALR
jgi:hypothetical protein